MSALAIAPLGTPSARADEVTHTSADHPAVVVQRLHRAAGYDYASKFYPHPAGLRLYSSPPPDATPPSQAELAAGVSAAAMQGHTGEPTAPAATSPVTFATPR
jgi:hypothetical protein